MILRVVGLLSLVNSILVMAASTDQTVFDNDNRDDFARPAGSLPTLADLLTVEARASIFYSYLRETDMSARFLKVVDEGTTVFVPTNKAVQALARKPHEDPAPDVGVSDAEHEAISKSNVQRWVGAHIIPTSNVNFTSSKPYNTLTPGATIAFQAINNKQQGHPIYEPVIDSDAVHLESIKGAHVDTDAAHMAGIKGPFKRPCRRPGQPLAGVDTDAAHFALIKGPVSSDRSRQDTDATRLSAVKGPTPPDVNLQTPTWKQYELNDGVHIIAEKKASNGVMYLIDGTVPV